MTIHPMEFYSSVMVTIIQKSGRTTHPRVHMSELARHGASNNSSGAARARWSTSAAYSGLKSLSISFGDRVSGLFFNLAVAYIPRLKGFDNVKTAADSEGGGVSYGRLS